MKSNWNVFWQALSELKEITNVLQNESLSVEERVRLHNRRVELLEVMDDAVPPNPSSDTHKNKIAKNI